MRIGEASTNAGRRGGGWLIGHGNSKCKENTLSISGTRRGSVWQEYRQDRIILHWYSVNKTDQVLILMKLVFQRWDGRVLGLVKV